MSCVSHPGSQAPSDTGAIDLSILSNQLLGLPQIYTRLFFRFCTRVRPAVYYMGLSSSSITHASILGATLDSLPALSCFDVKAGSSQQIIGSSWTGEGPKFVNEDYCRGVRDGKCTKTRISRGLGWIATTSEPECVVSVQPLCPTL